METFVVLIFVLGYIFITLEHQIKIDKLVPALLMMALSWSIVSLGIDHIGQWFDSEAAQLNSIKNLVHEDRIHLLESTLLHHFGKTAEILIFLIGAMTIVEIIDQFEGFGTIKGMIRTRKKVTLLWIICFLAFFLSSIIDNLTATIVLISILRKIVPNSEDRLWYAGFIIIAANAGGAWSPIGDVTTTMLWLAGKVTTGKLFISLGLPSLFNLLTPLTIASFMPAFKGQLSGTEEKAGKNKHAALMLYLGLICIVFVPIFKMLTHLPPYIGMMFSLSIYALTAEFVSKRTFSLANLSDVWQNQAVSPTLKALGKIEMSSILFFLGILMAVAAMESLGVIFNFGESVKGYVSENVFVMLLGIISAIIDNVPLVAASIGMFQDAPDSSVWHFIAYTAGTGGSILIIGSAAGVVAMGMEKISFGWFLKNITLLALAGYISGIFLFLITGA